MFDLKKKLFIILLSIACAFSMAGCDKPQSLAEFIDTHESVKETFESLDSAGSFDMAVDGNTITCEYDITNLPDMTEEAAMFEENVKAFEDGLEAKSDAYSEFIETLEEESEIEGITIVVIYSYKDKVIASREFTSTQQ
jgi:uncharacterized lipoprotein YehR (DUF1307 family)